MNAAWGDLEYLRQGLDKVGQAAVDYINNKRKQSQMEQGYGAIEQYLKEAKPPVAVTPGQIAGPTQASPSGVQIPTELPKATIQGQPNYDPTSDPRYKLMRGLNADPITALQMMQDHQQLVEGAGGAKFRVKTDPITGEISADQTPVIPGEAKPTHYATEVDPNGVTQNTAYYSDGTKRYLGQAPDPRPTLVPGGIIEGGKNVAATLERDPKTGQWTVKSKGAELPAKPTANQLEINEPALDVMADKYLTDGIQPNFGMGQAGMSARAKFWNKVGDRAREQGAGGNDVAANQAAVKAYQQALSATQKILSGTTAAAENVKLNMQVVKEASKGVKLSGAKFVNEARNWLAGQTIPYPELTRYMTAIYTVTREYAKVTSGMALSAAGLTESAVRDVEGLLSAHQSPADINAAMDLMIKDMDNIQKGYADQASDLEAKIRGKAGAGRQPESQFINGKIYKDAKGNRARYNNGKWEPVQ